MYPRPLMHVRLSMFCLHGDCDCLTGGKEKETTGKHGLPLGMVSLCLSVASHVIYLAKPSDSLKYMTWIGTYELVSSLPSVVIPVSGT